MLGEYISSAPLTQLVKPGGGIRPIDGYLDGLQFGVGVSRGSEAILHSANRLIEACGDDVGLLMLLVELCYSNPARLYYGEHTLWSCQGVQQGYPLGPLLFDLVLHPLICKIRDSFILSLHAWYLDDGTIVGDTLVVGKLVMKRVAKTIGLMDAIAKNNDPQCELLVLRSCAGISRLYITMHTCPPRVFESAQHSFDVALRSSLERIVTASGPRFGDWQWRLATLPFAFVGLGNKLIRYTGIVSPVPIFYDALSVFNISMETDLLSNPSEIAAPKLRKKMADIYFTRVTKNEESTFSLSPRQMALWTSQREDHTSDWLKTCHCVLCYRLGIFLFSVSKPYSACLRVFAGDIYGDHVISCSRIIGIKHLHNIVCDTLVDICYRSGILAGKEVDIRLDGGHDKSLRPIDMLLYSWDRGTDVCVDLTRSSPLTQTGMVDFIPGQP
ncbi:hypothetical protein Tco_1149662 [Tanacetum coccineum]